jgi:hypothetical protein
MRCFLTAKAAKETRYSHEARENEFVFTLPAREGFVDFVADSIWIFFAPLCGLRG